MATFAVATPAGAAPAGGELELFALTVEGRIVGAGDTVGCLLGVAAAELNGRRLLDLVHADDRSRLAAELDALRDAAADPAGRPVGFEARLHRVDGQVVHLSWEATPAGDGAWRMCALESADLVDLLVDRRDLRTRLDLAIGQATAAMWELDVWEDRLAWEPQAAEILGVARGDLPACPSALARLVSDLDRAAVEHALAGLAGDGVADIAFAVGDRHLSLRGRVIDRDRTGAALRAVGLVIDVTTEKAMEEQLLRMSVSDPLTGAPNRRAFDQTLRGEWRRCARAGQPLSILMVDVDRFKAFNDRHGHIVGDQALVSIARALRGALPGPGDVLARYGGEEFAIVLPGRDARAAAGVADRLLAAVRATTIRQAPGWPLSVSIGAGSEDPGASALTAPGLLARADEALYAAKAAGRDRRVAYEDGLAARDALARAIADGLERDEFELHYQPIVALADGATVGYEALVRWNHPREGRLAPGAFIPAIEGTPLICALGRFALRAATRQLAAWSRDHPGLGVAVNIAAVHAASDDLADDVAAALAESGVAPGQLELEVTETGLHRDRLALDRLSELRARGVRVAIDDFGTGYTSIGELANLPADTLKIDRAFVASEDPRRRRLVALAVEAAHAFGLTVVAEGIETPEMSAAMTALGCDLGQGYLIARPAPAAELAL